MLRYPEDTHSDGAPQSMARRTDPRAVCPADTQAYTQESNPEPAQRKGRRNTEVGSEGNVHTRFVLNPPTGPLPPTEDS